MYCVDFLCTYSVKEINKLVVNCGQDGCHWIIFSHCIRYLWLCELECDLFCFCSIYVSVCGKRTGHSFNVTADSSKLCIMSYCVVYEDVWNLVNKCAAEVDSFQSCVVFSLSVYWFVSLLFLFVSLTWAVDRKYFNFLLSFSVIYILCVYTWILPVAVWNCQNKSWRNFATNILMITPSSHPRSGVVSVSFEEDEEGNLCLIAYPLHSESGDLENKDISTDCEPKSKMLKWSNKKQPTLLLENDNYSKERARHSRKEDKIMRWEWLLSQFNVFTNNTTFHEYFLHQSWHFVCVVTFAVIIVMRCSSSRRRRFSTSAWRKAMWFPRSNTTPGVLNVTSSTYKGWRRMQSTVTNIVSFHKSKWSAQALDFISKNPVFIALSLLYDP